MSDHARLSFSAAERWLRCPASVNMTRDIPDKSDSVASREGTFAHAILEKSMNEWMMFGEEYICDIEVPDDLLEVVDAGEMREYLQPCMDYIIERFESFPGENKGIGFEQRVSVHYMTMREDAWGTSDVQIWSDDEIETIDLKYGKGVFVDSDTAQNKLYTLGKMAEFMKASRGDVPWDTVSSTIMQPRYPDAEGNIIRSTEYDPGDLMDWMEETVKPAMGLTDEPPPPVPGEKQCRWCLAKPTCPAAKREVEIACSVFLPAEGAVISEADVPAVGDLTDADVEHLLNIHDMQPFINGYLKAVSERIRKLLDARDPRLHERLKLVVSRRNTNYKEGADIESLVAGKGKTVKDGYIPRNKLFNTQPISAAQMLKTKLNKAQKERLQELITKSEGSLSIVPWADPRDNAKPPIPFEAVGEVASEQLSDGYDFL